jgi:hypothetical protein
MAPQSGVRRGRQRRRAGVCRRSAAITGRRGPGWRWLVAVLALGVFSGWYAAVRAESRHAVPPLSKAHTLAAPASPSNANGPHHDRPQTFTATGTLATAEGLPSEGSQTPPTTAAASKAGRAARDAQSAPEQPAPDRWLAVLTTLDHRRSLAWRRGDPGMLRAVYVPGSPPLRADQAMLRSYVRRGLCVADARMTFGAPVLVSEHKDAATLVVVDRLRPAAAVDSTGNRTPLPRDRPSRHRIALRSVQGHWRIAAITLL